jgi:hypothetical protein
LFVNYYLLLHGLSLLQLRINVKDHESLKFKVRFLGGGKEVSSSLGLRTTKNGQINMSQVELEFPVPAHMQVDTSLHEHTASYF